MVLKVGPSPSFGAFKGENGVGKYIPRALQRMQSGQAFSPSQPGIGCFPYGIGCCPYGIGGCPYVLPGWLVEPYPPEVACRKTLNLHKKF